MTTYGLSDLRGTILLPKRGEIVAMLQHPVVAGIAIVMATLVVLGALGAIVFLAYNGKGTEAIGGLLLGLVGLVLGRIQGLKNQINAQTEARNS